MRRVLTIAAVVGLLCVMAVPASAAKPEVFFDETIVGEGIEVLDDLGEPVCDFTVFATETIKIRGTDFFDKDGNLLRWTLHLNGTSYYWSEWVTLPKAEHWSWVMTVDEESVTSTKRGNSWGLIGILEERGRIIFDDTNGDILFEAGKWPVVNDGYGPLCDALAEPS